MARVREWVLNFLLAGLAMLSLVLSYRVLFPPDRYGLLGTGEARVQLSPALKNQPKPNVFRPERLYLRDKTGRTALISAGSDVYRDLWPHLEQILTRIRLTAVPTPVDQQVLAEGEAVTLVLPTPLSLPEWATEWRWTAGVTRPPTTIIDRVIFHIGRAAHVYLSGPTGASYRVDSIPPGDVTYLQELIASAPAPLMEQYRVLAVKDAQAHLTPGLKVPAVTAMELGRVKVIRPTNSMEEVRYFPDLSVVRQIEERYASSFTDGQRLVRITTSGILEYLGVSPPGTAPDMSRALRAAEEWMGPHGGWPSDVVLTELHQQIGRTVLQFDLRLPGSFPVESTGGALLLSITSDRTSATTDHVTHLRRYPDISLSFGPSRVAIITPERAVEMAADAFPRALSFETVREVYPAYRLLPPAHPGDVTWSLEPVWVIVVGEERIYVPADPRSRVPVLNAGSLSP